MVDRGIVPPHRRRVRKDAQYVAPALGGRGRLVEREIGVGSRLYFLDSRCITPRQDSPTHDDRYLDTILRAHVGDVRACSSIVS